MNVVSLFSGIGGFDFGLERAGHTIVLQVENDPFCTRILERRWPNVPRYGDIRTVSFCESDATGRWAGLRPGAVGANGTRAHLGRNHAPVCVPVDLLVGGFPCQDLSVAGKRLGLGGTRSSLFHEFVRIAAELRPTYGLIENVPGLLSSHGGRDFWTVLTGLRSIWPVVGWRVLDSRFFGVPQRRRRIYVVGGPSEASVRTILSLTESGARHPEAGGEAGADVAYALAAGAGGSKFGSGRARQETFITHTLTGDQGFDASEDGTGRGTPLVIAFDTTQITSDKNYSHPKPGDPPLAAGMHPPAIAFDTLPADGDPNILLAATLNSGGNTGGFRTEPGEHLIVQDTAATLRSRQYSPGVNMPGLGGEDDQNLIVQQAVSAKWAKHSSGPSGDECQNLVVADPISASEGRTYSHEGKNNFRMHNVVPSRIEGAIRRLTPLECERLQGFPDGFTCLCTPLKVYAADPDAAAERCSCPDSPRYRALGNAVTTTVIEWLGRNLHDAGEEVQARGE